MSQQTVIWPAAAAGSQESLEELARQALALGGRRALAAWLGGGRRTAPGGHVGAGEEGHQAAPGGKRVGGVRTPGAGVAHVHGERHQLWWEFPLEASFRWQGHLYQLRPALYRSRLRRLTRALGLEGLLTREVAALTHEARALADLAVALLPGPALLLWEEPFYLLGQAEAARAARLVRELHAEGMALVAVAAEPPGLHELEAVGAWRSRPLLHLAP